MPMTFAMPRAALRTSSVRPITSGSAIPSFRHLSAAAQAQPVAESSSIPDLHNAAPAAPAMTETAEAMRLRAIKLYKELHRLGRDYPDPEYGFNKRLRRAYEKNSKTTDPAALKKQLELAEHIKKEVLALISLKKFRHLRRSYHANEGPR